MLSIKKLLVWLWATLGAAGHDTAEGEERLGTGEGRPWGKGSNEVSLWPLGLSHPAFHASGRHASCDAAALALVRHLVSEYPEAALAELCDTTFL